MKRFKYFLTALVLVPCIMIFSACNLGRETDNSTVPGQITELMVTGLNGGLEVAWDAPSSDGGTEITAYEITIDNWATKIIKGALDRTHTFTGLTNGTQYTVTARALNEKGAGEQAQGVVGIPSFELNDFLGACDASVGSVTIAVNENYGNTTYESNSGTIITTFQRDGQKQYTKILTDSPSSYFEGFLNRETSTANYYHRDNMVADYILEDSSAVTILGKSHIIITFITNFMGQNPNGFSVTNSDTVTTTYILRNAQSMYNNGITAESIDTCVMSITSGTSLHIAM